MTTLTVHPLFDPNTFSYTYVVWDGDTREAAVIDPVYDFDPVSGKLTNASACKVKSYVAQHNLEVRWLLETHVHADHLSAAQLLKKELGGEICIGANIGMVQCVFSKVLNAEPGFSCDGAQFDRLLYEGDKLAIGVHEVQVLATPGHTPACVSYLVQEVQDTEAGSVQGHVFVGDTLFMPDYGTARTDFPGGCADQLYESIQKLLTLPAATRMYMCHDYGTADRPDVTYLTTVKDQRQHNIHVGDGHSAEDFVDFRRTRDAQLAVPRLLYPAVQFNMRAGLLPEAEDNGSHYFKIPIKPSTM